MTGICRLYVNLGLKRDIMKRILATVIILLLYSTAFGQIQIGADGGYSLTTMHMREGDAEYGTSGNLNVHLRGGYKINNDVALFTGIGFITRGHSTEVSTATGAEDRIMTAKTISVPVLGQFTPFLLEHFNIDLYLGMTNFFTLDMTVEQGGEIVPTPDYSPHDLALTTGAGVTIPINADHSIVVEGMVDAGMNDLFMRDGFEVKARQLSVNVGYRYSL